MEASDHVVIMNVVGLVKDHNERILVSFREKMIDIDERRVSRELVAEVGWMLSKVFTEDCPGALIKAFEMGLRGRGALFQSINRVACEHSFSDIAGTADRGGARIRYGPRWLKRTKKPTHL